MRKKLAGQARQRFYLILSKKALLLSRPEHVENSPAPRLLPNVSPVTIDSSEGLVMFESYENPSVKSSDSNAASSKLSAQIFSDPKDFLSTLQSSFKQLSHGHDQLTAADLKLDAADPTLDAKTRAAAQIGFDHFKDFAGLSYQGEPAAHNTPKQNDAITSGDLSFAQDMNNHDTLSYKLENIARDTAVGVMGAAAGVFRRPSRHL